MGEVRDNVQRNLIFHLSSSGITQKEFAIKLGVSQSSVTNWVKGSNSPDIEVVARICDVLGISVSQLFYNQEKQPTPQSGGELSQGEEVLVDNYRQLNDEGQEKLTDYSDDLVASGRYKKDSELQVGGKMA